MTSTANPMETKAPADPPLDDSIITRHRKTQVAVVAASVVSIAIFWTVGDWLGIPAVRKFQGSLLQLKLWPLDIIVIYLLIALSMVLGSVIAGRFWFYAGLFAAATGLAALSVRGGPMHNVLFNSYAEGTGQRVFLELLLEHCLLAIPVAFLWIMHARGFERAGDAQLTPPKSIDDANIGSVLMSLAIQTILMGTLVYFLTPTDSKKQILLAVFLSGLVAAEVTEQFFPAKKAAVFYWIAPILIGAVGYLSAYLNGADFSVGVANGALGNLARPLPLDYCSVGIAGTLLGYWIGAERPELAMSVWATLLSGHYVQVRAVKPVDN